MGKWTQSPPAFRALAAMAAGILFVAACTWVNQAWVARMEPTVEVVEPSGEVRNEGRADEAGPEDQGLGLPLTDQERQMMDVLREQMEVGDYQAVGILLNEQPETYQEIFYGAMDGKRYLYDGERFTEEIEGEGLVLDKGNTAFYGAFRDGAPDGECLAIQAVNLDFPRYDYAKGTWKEGMMNGFGQVGYDYYQGNEREESQKIIKEGEFKDNLMDGDIAYTSVSIEGYSATWHMAVKEGVIQLDDRWMADSEDGTYYLLAEGDATQAYVVSPFDLERVFWQNLIYW